MEDKREQNYRRNLRRIRKNAAARKKEKRVQEREERKKIAQTARQQREYARQKERERRLANGGKISASGLVLAAKVNAAGQLVTNAGRKDKRTDKHVVSRLLKALKEGHTLTDSSIIAGVSPKTLNTWLNQGADAEEGTLARTFYEQVELAKVMALDDCVKSIKKAAKRGAWQAAAWFLEKRAPEVYGKKSEVSIGQNKPFEVAIVDAAFSEDEMKAALKAVLSKNPELMPPIIDAEIVEE